MPLYLLVSCQVLCEMIAWEYCQMLLLEAIHVHFVRFYVVGGPYRANTSGLPLIATAPGTARYRDRSGRSFEAHMS